MFCIDANCALTFYMAEESTPFRLYRKVDDHELNNKGVCLFPEWAYAPDGRVNLMATSRDKRCQRAGFLCHLAERKLPNDSFIQIDNNLIIPSPELCFLRLAYTLPLHELVKAGMLLCSNFSFDKSGQIVNRKKPLTCREKIVGYVSSVENYHGAKNARKSLDYITDGAASPPEIDSYIMFSLKPIHGGYGLTKPEPNGHVKLHPNIARSLGYRDCYCDLLWREEKCAVEYTSQLFHEGYEERVRDEVRRSALEAMGYRVFFLTKNQLYSMPAFDGFVRSLKRQMGKRLRNPSSRVRDIRYQVRRDLLYQPSWIISRACRY